MDLFTRTDLRELLEEHEQPRVSLFSPTHRDGAEEEAAFKRSAEIDARRASAEARDGKVILHGSVRSSSSLYDGHGIVFSSGKTHA